MCYFMVEKGFLMLLKMATFPIKIEGTNVSDLATQDKVSDHSNLKTLTFKVFFKDYQQLLPITQVKVGKTSENLLNEVRQIIYYLY